MKHLYYGFGKGKTTCTIGIAIRAIGANKKVLFVQFLKSENTCERAVLKDIKNLTLTDCPTTLKLTYNMTNDEFADVKKYYNNLYKTVTDKDFLNEFDVIIYDEIFSLVDSNIITKDALLSFVDSISDDKEYVFTAHSVDELIINKFDYVSHIKKDKHPFDKGVSARKGIEF